jgi:hypothetical protein
VDEANQRGMKRALPAFYAGTPEWAETQALVSTGMFGAMKAGGHILTGHESVFGAEPVEKGYGDLIPGLPVVAGVGSLCFRYRYLYSLLAALPFTIDPDYYWRISDYTYAYAALLDYLAAEKDKPNAVPPTPATNPTPNPAKGGNQPVTPPPPAPTHRVKTILLNLREFPWVGRVVPPLVGTLDQGAVVTVLRLYKTDDMPFECGCISADGNQWISMQWVEAI